MCIVESLNRSMKENHKVNITTEVEHKNNELPKNKHFQGKELFKYKKSLFIINKSIHLLRNHYYNKICRIDSDRKRKHTKLIYLKKKNVLLEDKCSFYSEHVEELKQIYSKQLKSDEAVNLENSLNRTNNTNHEDLSNNNKQNNNNNDNDNSNILKLREEQIERLTEQLNIVNNLYMKQVDNNKKFLRELDEANKNIHYQNNKIQEQKIYIHILKRELKFCKKYSKRKQNVNFNLNNIKEETEPLEKENDVCLSVLCFLKSELEIIDDENKKRSLLKEKKKCMNDRSQDFLLKFVDDPFFKFRKIKIFDQIKKKNIFSYYKEIIQKKEGTNEAGLKKLPSLSKNYKRKMYCKNRGKYYHKKGSSFKSMEKKKIQKEKSDHKNFHLSRWNSLSSITNNIIERNNFTGEYHILNEDSNDKKNSSNSSDYISFDNKSKMNEHEKSTLEQLEDPIVSKEIKIQEEKEQKREDSEFKTLSSFEKYK